MPGPVDAVRQLSKIEDWSECITQYICVLESWEWVFVVILFVDCTNVFFLTF